MSKLYTALLLSITFTISGLAAANTNDNNEQYTIFDGEQYWTVGIGVTSINFNEALNNNVSNDWFTYVEGGIGYEFNVADDWRLASELSVVYGNNTIRIEDESPIINQNLEQIGIWGSSRLNYDGFSDTLSPFVELGVGRMHTSFDDQHHSVSHWDTVTRAAVGLEYRFTEDFSFAFSVGTADSNDLTPIH